MRGAWWRGALLGAALVCVSSPALAAPPTPAPPDTAPLEDEGSTDVSGVTDEAPPITLPLVPVPAGCTAPEPAQVVFVGTVVERDYRSIRYRIDQIRYGSAAPFAALDARGDELIDVRYGLDAQYLSPGEHYLVGGVVDPDLGLLVSRVSDPIENFGGDEVIGVSETDVSCPAFEDPMRTLHPDGTTVATPMLKPFFDAKLRIVGAVLVPFGLACAVLLVLSALRLSATGAANMLRSRGA